MKITAIRQQVKRKDRYSIYIDGTYAFSLSEAALIEQRLASGQDFTTAEVAALKKAAGLDKVYGNALRYVAMRLRSEWEVTDYLRRKDVDSEAALPVVDRLKKLGLLDDAAFARAWVANRRLLRSTSTRKLTVELRQKHIAADIIAQVLRDDESDERDMLRAVVDKKAKRYPDRQKFMQYLARQGFSFDDISAVLDEKYTD